MIANLKEIKKKKKAFPVRSNVSSLFGKIATLLKSWYTIRFFVKIFFLRPALEPTQNLTSGEVRK